MAARRSHLDEVARNFHRALRRLTGRYEDRYEHFQTTELSSAAIFVDASGKRSRRLRWSDEDVLDCLRLVTGLRVLLDQKEGDLLARGRELGIPFQTLAYAIGRSSRQAAEQRLIRLETTDDYDDSARLDQRRLQRLGVSDRRSWTRATWMQVAMLSQLPDDLFQGPIDPGPQTGD